MRNVLLAATVAALTAGCGGGGSSSEGSAVSPSSVNTAPTITGLTEGISIAQDSSSEPVTFRISDAEAAPDTLQLSVASSNTELLTTDAIELVGNEGERALLLRPTEDASGATTLTITATDAQGLSVQRTLNVNVTSKERSFREMVDTAYARQADGAAEETTGYDWVDNPEDDDKSFDHLLAP